MIGLPFFMLVFYDASLKDHSMGQKRFCEKNEEAALGARQSIAWITQSCTTLSMIDYLVTRSFALKT